MLVIGKVATGNLTLRRIGFSYLLIHAKFFEQKGINVSRLADFFVQALADAVPRFERDPQQNRLPRRLHGLQPGGHFVGIRRIDPAIIDAGE